jgi:hypothetical protein
MKIKYLAEVMRDTSETSYTTVFSKVFNTEKEGEEAIKNVFGCLKWVKPINVNYCECEK